MANLMRWTSILSLLFSWGCGKNLPYSISSPSRGTVDPGNTLSGNFTRIDHSSEDLSQALDKPTVLIFSQDTCQVCAHEADSLLGHLNRPHENPSRVHIYTVLVGSDPEDAVDWKQDHPVPWEVGVDRASTLFKHYCAIHTVPCIITYLPSRGIVLRRNGPAEFDELTSITGKWEE